MDLGKRSGTEATAESASLCEHRWAEIGRRLKTVVRTALIDSLQDASAAVGDAERASNMENLAIARASNMRT